MKLDINREISDFINLDQKLKYLNVNLPSDFCILPENIEDAASVDEFVFTDTTLSVKKYLKKNGVNVDVVKTDTRAYRQRRSVDFFAPVLFIGYSVLSENPELASVGLNVLSSYVYDIFKGTFGDKKVKIEIIVEVNPKKKYKSITYEGNVEGLNGLADVIKSLKDE
ncbi:hypothetical protein [Hymenobacter cellulosivorans]|uniref:Uncharacterized protein n=1 Tax=Hymenobacter cellulosivorans TaxID=2932249 RepID=A0ABY4F371_9BACT|nr:hypothetical protein [Hymenobacter cellulosivorans]UOQ51113.1 hypothetical protein MUN80_15235 [Hymenobacter cellulosivorans]